MRNHVTLFGAILATACTSFAGQTPVFNLSSYSGRSNDVIFGDVDFGNGHKYSKFIHAKAVHSFTYEGPSGDKMCVKHNGSKQWLNRLDGNSGSTSSADLNAFSDLATAAFSDRNLNHYVDISGGGVRFSCIVEFDRLMKDNDPGQDSVPELIYFERGTNGGNSTLTIEALDMEMNPVGLPLVIMPHDAVHTTPRADVDIQTMSGVAIDLSQLGVTKCRYLRMRTPRNGDTMTTGGVYSGGEQAPDFKMLFIQTYSNQVPSYVLGD